MVSFKNLNHNTEVEGNLPTTKSHGLCFNYLSIFKSVFNKNTNFEVKNNEQKMFYPNIYNKLDMWSFILIFQAFETLSSGL